MIVFQIKSTDIHATRWYRDKHMVRILKWLPYQLTNIIRNSHHAYNSDGQEYINYSNRVEVKFCWYGKKASVVANRKLKFGRERKKERQETEQRQKNRSASYISH